MLLWLFHPLRQFLLSTVIRLLTLLQVLHQRHQPLTSSCQPKTTAHAHNTAPGNLACQIIPGKQPVRPGHNPSLTLSRCNIRIRNPTFRPQILIRPCSLLGISSHVRCQGRTDTLEIRRITTGPLRKPILDVLDSRGICSSFIRCSSLPEFVIQPTVSEH